MIYGISDSPKTLKEYLLYGAQQMISVLAATLLVCEFSHTDFAAGLVGAGIATIIFLIFTKFKAPLFFSVSGATIGVVTLALGYPDGEGLPISHDNFLYVIIGGLAICLMNLIVSFLIKRYGVKWLKNLLSPVIAGTIVVIIGLHLSKFCLNYFQPVNDLSNVLVGFITMVATVLTMHYGKGRLSTLPLLVGMLAGFVTAAIFGQINWSVFAQTPLFIAPKFAFANINLNEFDFSIVITIIIAFAAVNLANLAEHIGDITAVSNAVGVDISETVGFDKTMAGDGIADMVGCLIGGQPTTTYSESLSTIVISKVASTRVIFVAALMTIFLGFFGPFNAVIRSMPSSIFGGLGLVAYGCIAFSGIRTLHSISLSSKNMLIFGCMATVGISEVPIVIGNFKLSDIALAMIVGMCLNLILKDEKNE